MSRFILFMSAMLILSLPAAAQHAMPYAGQQDREIKALSEQEVADLLAGRGMGLAKAAELNSYPGPLHALDMWEALGLDPRQVAALEDQQRRMTAAAVTLGRQIVAAERELDRLFAERRIDASEIETRSEEIGRLQGRLRAVHLATHLETRATLSDAQVRRYDELRGYGGMPASGARQPQHRHKH
jgi:hypothetical protein